MKTILYLHSSSDLYGSDRCLLRTIEGLDRTRYQAVVCLPYDGPLVAALREVGAIVYVLQLPMLRRRNLSVLGITRYIADFVSGYLHVRRIVKQHRVDLLHSNTTAVTLGGVLSRWCRIGHIWHVREIIMSPTFIRKYIAKSLMRSATVVVGVSRSVIDNLAVDEPGIRMKSRVIYDGIRTQEFSSGIAAVVRSELAIDEDVILVGMLGRLGSWKGQELLLEAAIRLRDQGRRGMRFIAVGSVFPGNQSALTDLEHEIVRSKMGDLFSILAFRTDVGNILAALDVFVLPSVRPDPFPNTVLEAMAAGKPIVANAHGGVVEMLRDGESGFLVAPNDVAMMADRIAQLVDEPALRTRMGLAAQRRVRELFDISGYTVAMNALYDEATAEQSE